MPIKIIADSSCDLSTAQARALGIDLVKVPFTLQLGESIYIDNEEMDVAEYVRQMNAYPKCPKTAAPSPQCYLDTFTGDCDIYVVTISSKLSASYQNAIVAQDAYLEEHPEGFVHVFDSRSASAGVVLAIMKIQEEYDRGSAREELIENVTRFIGRHRTYFLLEQMDNLVKAGRLSPIALKLATVLNICPVLGNTADGYTRIVEKVRGKSKVLKRLVAIMLKDGADQKEKILTICHVNNLKKALCLKEEVMKCMEFKDILIFEARGLVANYAQEFGIVLSFSPESVLR